MAPERKKPSDNRKADRHKGRKMVGIRLHFADPMQQWADREGSDLTEEVNRAVKEFLEKRGLWPAQPKQQPDA